MNFQWLVSLATFMETAWFVCGGGLLLEWGGLCGQLELVCRDASLRTYGTCLLVVFMSVFSGC